MLELDNWTPWKAASTPNFFGMNPKNLSLFWGSVGVGKPLFLMSQPFPVFFRFLLMNIQDHVSFTHDFPIFPRFLSHLFPALPGVTPLIIALQYSHPEIAMALLDGRTPAQLDVTSPRDGSLGWHQKTLFNLFFDDFRCFEEYPLVI